MIELLFFILGLIIGLLTGVTFISIYFLKKNLDDKNKIKECKDNNEKKKY